MTMLELQDIHVHYRPARKLLSPAVEPVKALNGVTFSLDSGRSMGLVGESGSGKSTLARAILRLTDIQAGTITFDGLDITQLDKKALLSFRKDVQGVLQDPYSSLNPLHDVSVIVGDPITRHLGIKKGAQRNQRIIELLTVVGLSGDFLHRKPHQMSGGQRQRVSLARALAVEPKLIVADEATSALDVSIQSHIVNLLRRVQKEKQVALLFIAHNLEVVKHIATDVGVMYLGYLVEVGKTETLYASPTHPYTEMLLASIPVPNPKQQAQRKALRQSFIDAEPASPSNLPPGCPFANRCPVAMDVCKEEMPELTKTASGFARCHLHTSGPNLGGETVIDYIKGSSNQL